MRYLVRIHSKDGVVEKHVEHGKNLLEFLHENSYDITSPCGGNGTCGKCRIKVEGMTGLPCSNEQDLLGEKALAKGFRLACYSRIDSNVDIYTDDMSQEAKIVTQGIERSIRLQPAITKKFLDIKQPDINDQAADIDRIEAFGSGKLPKNSLDILKELPEVLRSSDFKVTFVYYNGKIIRVEPGDTSHKVYGVAVDIGTTTIAAYLVDLVSGEKADVYSVLNPQKKYGADVLSRIDYSNKTQSSLAELNTSIINCLNDIIEHFIKKNNLSENCIYAMNIVGNTTMMHFVLGISPRNIAFSPFIPVTTRMHVVEAKQLGIKINQYGYVFAFPGVSAYIGADTIAAVLSSGMYADNSISLMIDIGTNGEIVLGNDKWMYSCSTAAGPAFEGANITNGVGGIKGAIDRVTLGENLQYTTIGNQKAIGICGSGIVDIVAEMLEKGIIDGTGRINGEEEMWGISDELAKRIISFNGQSAFLIEESEKCDSDTDIVVTQKDVRELQNAKAAIAAGIKTLVKRAGIDMGDIDKVYLAGGFGNYINIESAVKIGLIPTELRDKIISIGNAAGAGAVEGLISESMLHETEKIKDKIKYIELSASPDFNEEYIECMMFDDDL